MRDLGGGVARVIRRCDEDDFNAIWEIVNDAAEAYRGVIPDDCWAEPYMSREKLRHEIQDGVVFWGFDIDGVLAAVMGIQSVADVTLIRHAYVRTACQGYGFGGLLLSRLRHLATAPVLIGTWASAEWAIRFYERHGFRIVPCDRKDALLYKYWSVSPRQIETSVVLADEAWRTQEGVDADR